MVQKSNRKHFKIRKTHACPVPTRTLWLQFSPHAPRLLGIGSVLGAVAMILDWRLGKNRSQNLERRPVTSHPAALSYMPFFCAE